MQLQIAETQELRRQVDRITEAVSSVHDGMHKNSAAIMNSKAAGVPQHTNGVAHEAVSNKSSVESTIFSGTAPHGRPQLPIDELHAIEPELQGMTNGGAKTLNSQNLRDVRVEQISTNISMQE